MKNRRKHSEKSPVNQGREEVIAEPNKIGAGTTFDFEAKNLTAYGGLLPVAAMLERLGFQQLMEEALTVKRTTKVMPVYQFVLALVLAIYVGFSRLHHLRFLEREPMLTGILKVLRLPPQCTFWRFLGVAASGSRKTTAGGATADAATSVGSGPRRTGGGHAGYRHHGAHLVWQPDGRAQELQPPKNKGKKSYQPILTFLAETREYISVGSCATGIGLPGRRSPGT